MGLDRAPSPKDGADLRIRVRFARRGRVKGHGGSNPRGDAIFYWLRVFAFAAAIFAFMCDFILKGLDPIYPIIRPESPLRLYCALALVLPVVWWLLQASEKYTDRVSVRLLIATFAWVTVLQWSLHALAPFSLKEVIKNPSANSFYRLPDILPAKAYLAHFLDVRGSLPLHATANMPGKGLFFYALRLFGKLPVEFALVVLLVSNLGGFFVHALAFRLSGSHRGAFYAAVLYWLHPAKLFFFPLLNTVTPVLLLASLWLLLKCIDSPKPLWIFCSGLSLFALFLFDPLPLGCGLFHAFFLGHSIWSKKRSFREAIWIAAGTVASFFLGHFLFWFFTGFQSIGVFFELVKVNSAFYQGYTAPFWYLRNIGDLAVGLGCGTGVALMVCLAWQIKNGAWSKLRGLTTAYAAVFVLTLVVFEIMGVTRGEILRLWIFLACMAFPFLGPMFARIGKPAFFRSVVMVNLAQTMIALFFVGFIWWP
jgi:hypothetical protein